MNQFLQSIRAAVAGLSIALAACGGGGSEDAGIPPPTGTVVGALGGAVLGSAVAGHGNKTEGAVIGAGLGGLTGHQLAKKNAKKNCHYVYRRY